MPKKIVMVENDLYELVTKYLAAKKQDLNTIEKNIIDKDFKNIQFLSHKMKGVAAMYGFPEITEMGHAMEEAAKEANTNILKEQLQLMQFFFNNVEIERKSG